MISTFGRAPTSCIAHVMRKRSAIGSNSRFSAVDLQRLVTLHAMKHAAHEEALAEVVVENGQFVDIAMMPVEKADDGGDLSRRARTRDGEHQLMRTGIGGHAVSTWRS